jgi:hypothetical protein
MAYNTEITDDAIGYLTVDGVVATLRAIASMDAEGRLPATK